jgi:transcriptional/translational regulatory protein YebC/TACO1
MDFKNKQKLAPENGGSQSLLKADQTEKLIQHLSEITDVHHVHHGLYYAAILMPFFVRR